MRRIALVNQKGGVGKTTTAANLGAALARANRRVVLVDLDPQGNLSTHLSCEVERGGRTSYAVIAGECTFAEALRPTNTPNLWIVPTNVDLAGAELELAAEVGREWILKEAIDRWEREAPPGESGPADYLIFDCPPSLGLLSINALVAAREVFIALQTEFLALQGMTRLLDVIGLLQRRLNPTLTVTGIVPCLYDSRLRLAREILAELRKYFPEQCFRRPIGTNVKLAEAPSYGQTVFEYAPESAGARDYETLAEEVIAQENPAAEATSAAAAIGTTAATAAAFVAATAVTAASAAKGAQRAAPSSAAPSSAAPSSDAPPSDAPCSGAASSGALTQDPSPSDALPADDASTGPAEPCGANELRDASEARVDRDRTLPATPEQTPPDASHRDTIALESPLPSYTLPRGTDSSAVSGGPSTESSAAHTESSPTPRVATSAAPEAFVSTQRQGCDVARASATTTCEETFADATSAHVVGATTVPLERAPTGRGAADGVPQWSPSTGAVPLGVPISPAGAPFAAWATSDAAIATLEPPRNDPRVAHLQAVESRTGELRAAESSTPESRAAESRAVESRTAESRAVESRTVDTRTAESGSAVLRTTAPRSDEQRASGSLERTRVPRADDPHARERGIVAPSLLAFELTRLDARAIDATVWPELATSRRIHTRAVADADEDVDSTDERPLGAGHLRAFATACGWPAPTELPDLPADAILVGLDEPPPNPFGGALGLASAEVRANDPGPQP